MLILVYKQEWVTVWNCTERCEGAEKCNLTIGTDANNSQNRWPMYTDDKELTALHFENPLSHVSQRFVFLLIHSKRFICPCAETDTTYQIFRYKTFSKYHFQLIRMVFWRSSVTPKCVIFCDIQAWVIEAHSWL